MSGTISYLERGNGLTIGGNLQRSSLPVCVGDRARMARHPRLELPGIAQHVVQRGNKRSSFFLADDDRQRYLQCLRQAMLRDAVRLHAYVLMSNHVHLLLTPGGVGALSRMMHTFGRNYAGLFNGRHRRTGTLWEGRYKACLVDSQGVGMVAGKNSRKCVRAEKVSGTIFDPGSGVG